MKNKLMALLVLTVGFLFGLGSAQATSQTFPKKMRDFLLPEKQSVKSIDFLETDISVIKIKPWLYKVQYESQEPDGGDYYQVMYCMADFIASTSGFNYWDIGTPEDEVTPTDRNRYVRYVVMRKAENDDWIVAVKRENIQLENDFEQIERQVALARAYCPNQVQAIYLRQNKLSKPGEVYFVEGVKFSNKVRDYYKEDAIRGMDMNFLSGSILVKSLGNQVFNIQFQFEKPLDGVYALHLGMLATCAGQKLAEKKSFGSFMVGIPKEPLNKTQAELLISLGGDFPQLEERKKEIQWSGALSIDAGRDRCSP